MLRRRVSFFIPAFNVDDWNAGVRLMNIGRIFDSTPASTSPSCQPIARKSSNSNKPDSANYSVQFQIENNAGITPTERHTVARCVEGSKLSMVQRDEDIDSSTNSEVEIEVLLEGKNETAFFFYQLPYGKEGPEPPDIGYKAGQSINKSKIPLKKLCAKLWQVAKRGIITAYCLVPQDNNNQEEERVFYDSVSLKIEDGTDKILPVFNLIFPPSFAFI
ncbi:unnamed protein product [Dovyalis caffra]|uniref:Uncharacterized protein n=1 Tax=Dovyalis caffra TaxID=77055 RepID=A0AAV1R1K9_9ROSI|nr:unnamed protein product [Dovyalis caffra]